MDRSRHSEEALKKTRAEQEASPRANDELGRAMVKKDAEIKKIRTELTKAQALVTKYLMKEEQLIHDVAKAKDEVKRMWKEQRKHAGEINSLQRRLKHAKEWKDEATAFEQQLWKLRQELHDGEETWTTKKKKFSDEAVQMATDIRKLKDEVEEQRKENEWLNTELTKKENGMKELQT